MNLRKEFPPARFVLGIKVTLIILAGWLVYRPALRGSWLWDDRQEVTENALLPDPSGWLKAWTAPTGKDYFPFKTDVQWMEWHLWHGSTLGYHLVNLGLHLLSCLLLWRLLHELFTDRVGGPSTSLGTGAFGAWFGGLLFAVHPLAVESVAWISELKNTLSLPLLLGAMLAYVRYDRTRSGPKPVAEIVRFWPNRQNLTISATGYYLLSLFCFLLAMLSKSSVVMFPFVILLYAWWRRSRIGGADLKASAPFFLISLVLGLVTVHFQQTRAIAGAAIALGGIGSRVAGAGLAVVFYLAKAVFPAGLMPIYPHWAVDPPSLVQFLPWPAMAVVLGWCWSRRTSWGRPVLFGLGFFLLNLVPVLGFVPMAYFDISGVADHFAYLPLVGLIGLGAAGLDGWLSKVGTGGPPVRSPSATFGPDGANGRAGRATLPITGAAIVVAALTIASRRYAAIFLGPQTLWSYTLEHNPKAWPAIYETGQLLAQEGRLPEAAEHLAAAQRLEPNSGQICFDLGEVLLRLSRPQEAQAQYERTIQLAPYFAKGYTGLGNALRLEGRTEEAIRCYRQTIALDPDDYVARINLGTALAASDRMSEAAAEFEAALRIKPDDRAARTDLELARQSLER